MNVEAMSDEELMAIINAPAPKAAPAVQMAGPGAPADVSQLSDEELLKLLPPDFNADRFNAVPASGEGAGALSSGMKAMAEKRRSKGRPGAGEAAAIGAADWAGMGFADEIAGAANTGLDAILNIFDDNMKGTSLADRYTQRKRAYERRSDAAWEDHPYAYGAGAIPGFIASAAFTPTIRAGQGALRAAQAATYATPAARAAAVRAAERGVATKTGLATGALWGGVSGAGSGEGVEGRAKGAALGSVIGGVGGAALGNVADRAGSWLTSRAVNDLVEESTANATQRQADPFGIKLTRGQRTGDVPTQATENLMRDNGYGEDAARVAKDAIDEQFGQITKANDDITEHLAGIDPATGNPRAPISQSIEAGERLKGSIETLAAREKAAVQAADAQQVAAARQAADAIDTGLAPAAGKITDDYGLGDQVGTALRDRQKISAANRDVAYEQAAQLPTTIRRAGVEGMVERVKERLSNRQQPVVINKDTTNALDALQLVDDFSQMKGPKNAAIPGGMPNPDDVTGISAQGVEKLRQQLVARKSAAFNKGKNGGDLTDYHAMKAIVDGFDEELRDTFRKGLFDGDSRWLDAYDHARSLHAEHSRTFRPDDQLKQAMRDIVDRDANPQEVANYIFGRAKVGEHRLSRDLINHLGETLGRDAPEFQAIKERGWQKLLEVKGGITHDTAQKVADRIDDFLTKRGRPAAEALFEEPERQIMAKYAQDLRNMATSRRTTPPELQAMLDLVKRKVQPVELARMVTGGTNKVLQTGTPGRMIDTVAAVFGRNSEEFAQVRQAVWRQMTTNPEGANKKGTQLLSENILAMVGGNGRPTAEKLFSAEELKLMADYAATLKRITGSPNAKTPPKTAPMLAKLLSEKGRMIFAMLGLVSGDVTGAATNFAMAQGAKMTTDTLGGMRANRLFNGAKDISLTRAVKDSGARTLRGTGTKGRKLAGPGAGQMLPSPGAALADEDGEGDAPPLQLRVQPRR